MSIFYSYVATANGPVCQIVDEFDGHKHYPIDCADIGTATMVATLPGQDWIDHALRRYFEYTLEQEAITNAELLEVELQDYYLMFPEYDPSLGSFVFNQDQYVLDNQPANDEEIQALLDLVRSIEELGV
jgi:hypothetical protein